MILPCAGQVPDTGNRQRSHSGKKDRLVRLSSCGGNRNADRETQACSYP